MAFRLTKKQEIARSILASDATHCLLYGGGRSGKTFLILRAIVTRAIVHKSRHAVLRFRFNHVKDSIVLDTFPKMMDTCFPDIARESRLDKSNWFYQLPNGSEVWFGGLDEKQRTDKILGLEFATIFFNECSQIPWSSRTTAISRLAQKTGLRLKAYYDCNPPSKGHWTYKVFIEKKHPSTGQPLRDPTGYNAFGPMNPKDNWENIAPEYRNVLEELTGRQRLRFLEGQFASEDDNALWTPELIDQSRFAGDELPTMQRTVIAVDPSGCEGEEDERSDEIGIIVCGLGSDGRAYVLEDLSGRFGPAEWGKVVVTAFDRYQADAVVGETNYGGAMVEATIKAAASAEGIGTSVPFRKVTASRGKHVRAEPISALFEQQKVSMVGFFNKLEDQLCGMTTSGYIGDRSPDRADAMVWGLTHLFPGMTKKKRDPEFHDAPGGRGLWSRMPRVIRGYATQKERYARR